MLPHILLVCELLLPTKTFVNKHLYDVTNVFLAKLLLYFDCKTFSKDFLAKKKGVLTHAVFGRINTNLAVPFFSYFTDNLVPEKQKINYFAILCWQG